MTPESSPTVAPGPSRRSRRLLRAGLAAALLLLAGGAAYLWLRPTSPAPPELHLAGAEPEAVAAIQEARAEVIRKPRSPAAWGYLGLLLFAHDYYAEAEPCLVRAEHLDPADPHWPYFQGLILLFRDADAMKPTTA